MRLYTLIFSLFLLPLGRADDVPGFVHVRGLGGIDEYRLESNGLTVLLRPQNVAPVVTFQVVYRVGSRNEVTGTTGATHILEHLMFKGSERFRKEENNSVTDVLGRIGGTYNASTWTDRTNYYATVGREQLETYAAVEADRMRNLLLRESDRTVEMTVVRNEYERGENSAKQALDKEVTAAAYLAHPYHHPTIGWRSDIEKVSQVKLREFYDTFYWPDNATVTIVGDFEPEKALTLIARYFGPIPRAPKPIPEVYTVEPEQTGPRRVILKRPGQLGTVMIAHKVVSTRHADMPALDVLGAILSAGRNSRLYRALIDRNLATGVTASAPNFRDGSLFQTTASLASGVTHDAIEKVILEEFEKIKREGVTAEEVARAVRRHRVNDAFRREGPPGTSSALCEWIAAGDWTLFVTYADKIKAVTTAEIQRVARIYFDPDKSTTGWFVPIAPGPTKPSTE